MKKLVSVTEVEGEGLTSLLGEEVILLCANYFYAGKLVGENDTFVRLDSARIVYETGEWNAKEWKDAQAIGDGHYVMKNAIESFRKGK